MSEKEIKLNENKDHDGIYVRVPEEEPNQITFRPQPGEWVMKITPEGIRFNRNRYPDSEPDDFAKAIIEILERALPVKFTEDLKRESDDKFYYQGKFFKTESEFYAFIDEYGKRQTTEEDFARLFDALKKDIWINIKARQIKFTNGELRSILEEIFFFALERSFANKTNVI